MQYHLEVIGKYNPDKNEFEQQWEYAGETEQIFDCGLNLISSISARLDYVKAEIVLNIGLYNIPERIDVEINPDTKVIEAIYLHDENSAKYFRVPRRGIADYTIDILWKREKIK
jgi:hypothetical protein